MNPKKIRFVIQSYNEQNVKLNTLIMKRAFAVLFALLISVSSFAQADGKKFRIGLEAKPGLAWNVSNRSGQEGGRLGAVFAYGFPIEYYFSDVIGFSSGIFMNHYRAGVEYTDSVRLTYQVVQQGGSVVTTQDLIESRTYAFNSVNVPLKLKAKTPEIGYLTYFLEFGLDNDIIYASHSRRNTIIGANGSTSVLEDDLKKIDTQEDVVWYRPGINIGAGVEYNLVGTTSLLMGFNWSGPIINQLRKESRSLNYAAEPQGAFRQELRTHRIELSIGLLF
jgi:opacity protein-like surface antigen